MSAADIPLLVSTGPDGPQVFASVDAWLDAQYAQVPADRDYERHYIPERAGHLLATLHRKGEAKQGNATFQVTDRDRFLAELAELKAHAPGSDRVEVERKADDDGRETIIVSFAGVELVRMHQFAGDDQPGRFARAERLFFGLAPDATAFSDSNFSSGELDGDVDLDAVQITQAVRTLRS